MLFIQAVRSVLFYLLFFGQTVVLAIFIGTIALVLGKGRRAPDFLWSIGRYWGRSNLAFLKYVVGIRSEVAGTEHIPAGGCIIAAKHQSDWDILAIMPHAPLPAFIAKKELFAIPFFGWAVRALNTISVDRRLGREAIPLMLKDAGEKLAHGSEVIIFPEGTRKAPLAVPDYKFGITRLYLALNVPVVPVAVNSGLFWGRNSLVLWPGTARARFLPPILPGLTQEAFSTLLRDTIETASTGLALEAFRDGLARPLPPDLRRRFESAATAGDQSP